MDNADENKTIDKNTFSILLGLALCFLILFVFGMTCVISKFVSVNNENVPSVFGLSVMEITSPQNESVYPQGSSVVIVSKKFDEIQVGDWVVYNSSPILDSENFGRVEKKSAEFLEIRASNSPEVKQISKSNVLGVAGSTNNFVCGAVKFLLSGWILWLFVIIPFVALLSIIFIWIMLYFKNRILQTETKVAEAETTEIEAVAQPKKRQAKQKKTPNYKKRIEGREQIEIDFDDLENQNLQDPIKTESKQIDNNHSLANKQPKSKQKEIQTQKIEIAKPKAKRKGDDYILEKLPPMDTNKPIREMLGKIATNENNSNVNNLLEKMRKQK